MGSNYEMKYINLIENKPYLTKQELGLLLEKSGKNLDKKILNLIKKEDLISLKKGLYVSKNYLVKKPSSYEEYIANMIYYPSYLSSEYVLAKNGIIPENVYVFTSVSLRRTRFFENKLGNFSYQKIKETFFTGYNRKDFFGNLKINIASTAKALFDFFYFKPLDSYENDIANVRINWHMLRKEDINEFLGYVKLSDSPKMRRTFRLLKKTYDRR